jgi:N-acetylglucosaminyldiphosphoundecaprenol N-acetyl-beta-D-mannosaminyltransferase
VGSVTAPPRTDVARRYDVLGVQVDAVGPAEAVAFARQAVSDRRRTYVVVANVHSVMEARSHPPVAAAVAAADLTVPDGMPLVWMGRLQGHARVERVYGPDLTLALCDEAALRGWRCFFYGGAAGVAEALAAAMRRRHPGLLVTGTGAPPFRPLTDEEDAREVAALEAARPDLVFVGLGCPKQELWMASHRSRLEAPVLVGVGAAFDMHAGRLRQAPRFLMRIGLEWLFRLLVEPRRLWRRYAVNNPWFMILAARQLLRGGSRSSR